MYLGYVSHPEPLQCPAPGHFRGTRTRGPCPLARALNAVEAGMRDVEAGMAEKAAEFREKGGEIYLSEDGTVRDGID